MPARSLPAAFLGALQTLEEAYLSTPDPMRGSGFGGGSARWRAEREPILDAVTAGGDFIDTGCANGYLLECLVTWAGSRGVALIPHGLDIGPRLVAAAQHRLPEFAANVHHGNVWDWQPPRRYRYVYAIADSVPANYLDENLIRVMGDLVAPGGRLILGHYGSRSRGIPPDNVAEILARHWPVAGNASGGDPAVSRFAWADHPQQPGKPA